MSSSVELFTILPAGDTDLAKGSEVLHKNRVIRFIVNLIQEAYDNIKYNSYVKVHMN